jgi:hypothetical protein
MVSSTTLTNASESFFRSTSSRTLAPMASRVLRASCTYCAEAYCIAHFKGNAVACVEVRRETKLLKGRYVFRGELPEITIITRTQSVPLHIRNR